MSRLWLWMRWSWRDLRKRWQLVTAIALVIALGTGAYAGLLSTSQWRRQSNDASFALLHTHDLRIKLSTGSTTDEGKLLALVSTLAHAGDVEAARERLIAPVQLAGPRDLLVSAEIVGTDIRPGPPVDGVSVSAGRALTSADDGAAVALVDASFARENDLEIPVELTLPGGTKLRVVGTGRSPEYFVISGGEGSLPFLSQQSYGVLFASLHTVQRAVGAPGRVNDLVLTLRPGADRDAIQDELRQALQVAQPPLAADVTTRDDIDAYRVLYDDIEGDTTLWRVVALLILMGSAFAALNLTTRVVEAQRREIGIGMALGTPVRWLAVRPLLFGAQIALSGVGLGLVVGWLVGFPLRDVLQGMLSLPVWRTPLQVDVFAQAAALGFTLPFAAVAWPVWRALRVEPVQAIQVGHLAARGGGLAPLLRKLPLPGRGYHQVPVRNLLRTPRRSLFTILGIAAAITTLVTTIGILDTFQSALDRAQAEFLHTQPDRVEVGLDTVHPVDGPTVRAVAALPEVGDVQTGMLLPATASNGRHRVELALEVLPDPAETPNPDRWRPTVRQGSTTGGIILAAKAARDLHLDVGATVLIEHPQAAPDGQRKAHSRIRVAGIHPNPLRMLAYVDATTAAPFGFAGSANRLVVSPSTGTSSEQVRRALLTVAHVASAQTAESSVEGMRASLDELLGILQIAGLVTLLLALLIAVNTTSIGLDERAREHATMLAFGLPTHTVLGMATMETALLGTLGAVAGIFGGYGVLSWMTAAMIPNVLPEIGVTATLATTTIAGVLVLAVLTVSLAPLSGLRTLRQMDVPTTLRVME